MQNFAIYLFKGILHYLNLIFNMIDLRELGFMWIIIFGLLIFFIYSKKVKRALVSLIKSAIGVVKTPPGIIFLLLFLGYYIYIAIFFEEKITLLFFVLSIYLFLKDYFSVNLDLLAESKNSVFQTIKNISIPAFLLVFQQISSMLEINDFSSLKSVLMSLIIIPIFSILFFVLKHYCIYDDFYKRYRSYIKFNDYKFFKIFNNSLIYCGSYKMNNILLPEFLKDNRNLDYKEMKEKASILIPEIVKMKKENSKIKKCKKIKIKKGKLFKFFHYIWLFNIGIMVIFVLNKRFNNVSYDISYYLTYSILIIYFWHDLMKIKKIENQFNYMIYLFIYIILIVILVYYTTTLHQLRLTELGFMIPIFIYIRCITYNKESPNLLTLPFLSKNNFFGLNPNNYYNNGKKKQH